MLLLQEGFFGHLSEKVFVVVRSATVYNLVGLAVHELFCVCSESLIKGCEKAGHFL